MIRNVSYNDKEIRREIDEEVGKSYGFRKRLKLKGTGSQRLLIEDASPEIVELLNKDTNLSYCNIEIRHKGIVIRFRSILETYAWMLPYQNLIVSRPAKAYYFSDQKYFMHILPAYGADFNQKFFDKLFRLHAEFKK